MRLCIIALLLAALSVSGVRQITEKNKQQVFSHLAHKYNKEQLELQEPQGDYYVRSASNIAINAAVEAKAAQAAQNAAGAEASHQAKSQLAQKALQAAKAAEVALAGKKAVVEQLQHQVEEANTVAAENVAAIRQQQDTVSSAMQVAELIASEVSKSRRPLEPVFKVKWRAIYNYGIMEADPENGSFNFGIAKNDDNHKIFLQVMKFAAQLDKATQDLVQKTKTGLGEKSRSFKESKARLTILQEKLKSAREECNATKIATHTALEAARAALGNVRQKKHIRNSFRTRKPTDA